MGRLVQAYIDRYLLLKNGLERASLTSFAGGPRKPDTHTYPNMGLSE